MKKPDSIKLDTWYNLNLDMDTRTIYFGPWNNGADLCANGDPWMVDDWSTQNLIKGLHVLSTISEEPINIHWFSFGGDWNAGMAIYDYIKASLNHITIHCYGRVRSMGTIILQACDERILSPNCEFLIHYGTMAIDEVHSKDAQAAAEEDRRCNSKMEDIYLDKIKEIHPRYTREKLQNVLKYDKYLLPEEAVELGLADKIL